MRALALTIAAVVVLTAGGARADAVPLVRWTAAWSPGTPDPLPMFFALSEGGPLQVLDPTGLPTIFDYRTYGTADSGAEFTSTSDNNPGFSAFAAKLTDGIPDYLMFGVKLSGGGAVSESVAVWGIEGDSRVDLHGFTVESFTFRILDLRFENNSLTWLVDAELFANTVEPVPGLPADVVVPLPAAAWGGIALLSGAGAARHLRRRRFRVE